MTARARPRGVPRHAPWMRLHLGGQVWRIYFVSPKSKHLIDSKGELVAGRTWVSSCTICLSNDLDEQAREDTLVHELLHALMYVAGAFGELQKVCAMSGGGDDAAQDLEDRIVHPLTPLLHRVLKDLGFVFPKGPSV